VSDHSNKSTGLLPSVPAQIPLADMIMTVGLNMRQVPGTHEQPVRNVENTFNIAIGTNEFDLGDIRCVEFPFFFFGCP
jgi:hypothetical protein